MFKNILLCLGYILCSLLLKMSQSIYKALIKYEDNKLKSKRFSKKLFDTLDDQIK